jgi:hypothetical protein
MNRDDLDALKAYAQSLNERIAPLNPDTIGVETYALIRELQAALHEAADAEDIDNTVRDKGEPLAFRNDGNFRTVLSLCPGGQKGIDNALSHCDRIVSALCEGAKRKRGAFAVWIWAVLPENDEQAKAFETAVAYDPYIALGECAVAYRYPGGRLALEVYVPDAARALNPADSSAVKEANTP